MYVVGGTALVGGSKLASRALTATNNVSINAQTHVYQIGQRLPPAAYNPWTYSIGLGGTAYYATDGDWNATREAAALPILLAPERAAGSLAGVRINVDRILSQYPKFNFRNYRPAGAYSGFPIPKYNGPKSAIVQRSLSQRIVDFRANPQNWERVSASAEKSTGAKGGVSIESVYRNSTTGETLHVHDVFKPSGGQIPKHPTFRDYGKGE
jgi:hypothetical protein